MLPSPRALPVSIACALLLAIVAPAEASCHENPVNCISKVTGGGSASGGFDTEVGGASIVAVMRADAGTESNGTPSVEPGAGGRLQVTFKKDSNESTQGETRVRVLVQQIVNWTWTTSTDRNFTFDLNGADRTETFRFQAPDGTPEGNRTFKVALVVGEEGVANPLTVVVDDRSAATGSSSSSSRSPSEPEAGAPWWDVPAPGAIVAVAAVALALLVAARRKA